MARADDFIVARRRLAGSRMVYSTQLQSTHFYESLAAPEGVWSRRQGKSMYEEGGTVLIEEVESEQQVSRDTGHKHERQGHETNPHPPKRVSIGFIMPEATCVTDPQNTERYAGERRAGKPGRHIEGSR
jgi:hypothetical protein